MLVVKLRGGLGNQMFQYAAGLNVAHKTPCSLVLDTSSYDQNNFNPKETPRHYQLDIFNINPTIATVEQLKQIKWLSKCYRILRKLIGERRSYQIKWLRQRYLDGYWQSEIYFSYIQDQLRAEFILKNPFSLEAKSVEQSIIGSSKPTVSLHIRRGDYAANQVTNVYHGLCSLNYYENATAYLRSKIGPMRIYVFSDDILWAKNNLHSTEELSFVSNNNIKDYEEIFLMKACRHNIIANSSFSWWGAWLNTYQDKIVVAPKVWSLKKMPYEKDIVPSTWIKI